MIPSAPLPIFKRCASILFGWCLLNIRCRHFQKKNMRPFNWNVSSLAAVASVACSASKLYRSFETHTALNTWIFHWFGTWVCFQNRSSFFSIGIVREIRRFISVALSYMSEPSTAMLWPQNLRPELSSEPHWVFHRSHQIHVSIPPFQPTPFPGSAQHRRAADVGCQCQSYGLDRKRPDCLQWGWLWKWK